MIQPKRHFTGKDDPEPKVEIYEHQRENRPHPLARYIIVQTISKYATSRSINTLKTEEEIKSPSITASLLCWIIQKPPLESGNQDSCPGPKLSGGVDLKTLYFPLLF